MRGIYYVMVFVYSRIFHSYGVTNAVTSCQFWPMLATQGHIEQWGNIAFNTYRRNPFLTVIFEDPWYVLYNDVITAYNKKPQHIITKPQHIMINPQHIMTEPQHIITKPEHLVTEPQYIMTNPQHIINTITLDSYGGP